MKLKIELRSAYNYDADAVSDETGISIDAAESVVQQQFADECDINTIVKRFGLTGELPVTAAMPVSGDFTGVTDFHSAMTIIRQAEESFMAFPASVRARFENDPQKLMTFLENADNRDEALRLGLIQPPPEVPRSAVSSDSK